MRDRLSYANVVATLALFLALGGTSYAAITITGKNVKNGSLTGSDVKNNSLASSDIKDRALLARDFKAGQLPQGARGVQGATGAVGATGATGPVGPSTAYVRSANPTSGVGTVTETQAVSIPVPAGSYVANGRVSLTGANHAPTLVDCTLRFASTVADVAEDAISPYGGAADYLDEVPLLGTGTLTSPGTITVSCRTINSGDTVDISTARLTAVRVGALAP